MQLYNLFYQTGSHSYKLYITNIMGHFTFKYGCVIQVAKGLMLDWFTVLL